MIDWFRDLEPVARALPAGCFTWGVTVLGASAVFFARGVSRALLDAMLGFAAGVMIAASVWYGQLSAAVEPLAAALGAAAVLLVEPVLPYALAYAAGAMIFVVVEELIPESQRGGHTDVATAGTLVGFTVMMVLDVALG